MVNYDVFDCGSGSRTPFCVHPLSIFKSSALWAMVTWPLKTVLRWGKAGAGIFIGKIKFRKIKNCLKPKASEWYIQDGLLFYVTFVRHDVMICYWLFLFFRVKRKDVLEALSQSWCSFQSRSLINKWFGVCRALTHYVKCSGFDALDQERKEEMRDQEEGGRIEGRKELFRIIHNRVKCKM